LAFANSSAIGSNIAVPKFVFKECIKEEIKEIEEV
jgi:hypothetical protein